LQKVTSTIFGKMGVMQNNGSKTWSLLRHHPFYGVHLHGGHSKQKVSMRLHVYKGQLSGTPKTFILSKGVKSKAKEPWKKSKKDHMTFARLHLEWFTSQSEVAMHSKAKNIKWFKMWISSKLDGSERKLKAID
jgi:hypothetical protein